MTTLQKSINLLESFGVQKSVSVSNGNPSYGVKEDTQNAYYVIESANGTKSIEVSDDVDLDGVFEEENIDGIQITTAWKSDNYGSAKYPVKVINF